MATDPSQPETSIPLVEEEAHVGKRTRTTGRVHIRTEVDELEQLVAAELMQETVEVERVPVDRIVDAAPPVRNEGDVTIVPVLEEVLVVEKRLVLKEELRIRRSRRQETEEIPVRLRKQRAVVERLDEEGSED
jgi:uncharacterized protein (TIGR02271 family)